MARTIQQLSDATYRIQHVSKKQQRQAVHFDCLKPFPPDVRLESEGIGDIKEETQVGDPVLIRRKSPNVDTGDVEEGKVVQVFQTRENTKSCRYCSRRITDNSYSS